MTDLAMHRPAYVPARPPVRRFVVALVVLAVAFGALWSSGLAAPRLSVPDSSGMYDTLTGLGVEHLRLHNGTPVAVEVRRVTVRDERVTITSVRVNGHDVATSSQKIAGGGATTLDVEFTCRPPDTLRPQSPASRQVKLEITVRTPIGLERTRTAGNVGLPSACLG